MDTAFWHRRWESNEIAFHANDVNPLLVKYFQELSIVSGRRVFVPLCGKTLDIPWLLANGYRVAGAELSPLAIEQLFEGLEMKPQVSRVGVVDHYRADSIDIFVGDILDVSPTVLGPVDAIYDRAALVALPKALRDRYTAHLTELTNAAPQLLICYEYDQRVMEGPPFSISHQEVHHHYGDRYELTLRATHDVPGGLKGTCAAQEHVWLLRHDD